MLILSFFTRQQDLVVEQILTESKLQCLLNEVFGFEFPVM